SLDTWAVLGWVFAFLMLVSFIIYYFHSKPGIKRLFFNLMPLFFIGIAASLYFGFKHKAYQDEAFGIIIAKEVDIKPEPNLEEETLYVLHEGTKLKIIDQETDFVRFELANGNTGWMKASAVKRL
ncbi:MAG: SH3 domain-containing protein, partial [Flavobacteriaceae bacterium]|nr:SH3 domain-containing protein [Flavobacteriaceae bacterium]